MLRSRLTVPHYAWQDCVTVKWGPRPTPTLWMFYVAFV